MPAARSCHGRSVALGPWRPASEREAIRRGTPALAARGSALADTRHGDQATGWSVAIAEGHVKRQGPGGEAEVLQSGAGSLDRLARNQHPASASVQGWLRS